MRLLLKRVFLLIFCLGFAVLPLLFWTTASSKEVTRVLFFERWVEIFFLISSVIFVIEKKKLKLSRFFLMVAVFFSIALVSSILGADFKKSLWGNYSREDGLICYVHLFFLSLIVYSFWHNRWKRFFLLSTIFASSLSSLLFIFNKTAGGVFEIVSFGQPILLSGYLLLTFPFIFYLFRKENKKTLRICLAGLLFLQTVAICLTGSLGGIIGLAIFFLLQIIELHQKNKKLLIGIIAFFLISIVILVLNLKFKNRNQYVAESRERIFTKLVLGWAKKPLLGYGWSNVDYAFEAVPWPLVFAHDVYVDKAHSTFLEIMVTTGILGLIAYLSALIFPIKRLVGKLKKKYDKAWWQTVAFVFLLYLFHSQTNVVSIAEEMIFWFSVGLALI